MKSVRQQLLELVPPAPDRSAPDDALSDATYALLRSANGFDAAVDGWEVLHVVRESDVSMELVGLMHVLPIGSVVVALHLASAEGTVAWSARTARADAAWRSRSIAGIRKCLHLYARGELADLPWTWHQPISGAFGA
jgi:hypothetical protein